MATASVNDLDPPTDPTANLPFLRRVRIRGYKSIAFCDVYLQPLTILVGRNSAGKSNFLDALAFLTDLLWKGTDEAVRAHGGRESILTRPGGHPAVLFDIESYCQDTDSSHSFTAKYELAIHLPSRGRPVVDSERLRISNSSGAEEFGFDRHGDKVRIVNFDDMPNPNTWSLSSHLYLTFFGSAQAVEFWHGLGFSSFYNFSPEEMRKPQVLNPGSMLERNGRNLASVIESVSEIDKDIIDRVQAYLSAIVDEVEGFEVVQIGGYETIKFRLRSGGGKSLEFDAVSMSDGTLRVLATLVAAFQVQSPEAVRLIGIEEPETALHPAAMRALVEALDEASYRKQILLTTHSAELLTDLELQWSQLLIVKNVEGQTQITPVDAASREIVERELYTLADLQRQDLLRLDQADLRRQDVARSGGGE